MKKEGNASKAVLKDQGASPPGLQTAGRKRLSLLGFPISSMFKYVGLMCSVVF